MLTLQEKCHLARRMGFSANNEQLDLLANVTSKEQAIEALLTQPASLLTLPDWHDSLPPSKSKDPQVRKQQGKQRREMAKELKYWWFKQMASNSSAIQEKLTLFWANHFTSSIQKVKWAPAMLQQNLSLRTHALGSFRDMLKAILKDPAMLVYLDNANSKKQAANENLSRELLELFTLGEGNYSEQDVKELARALTGASVDRKTGNYKFRKRFHDTSNKTIFAKTAPFGPDHVADLILRQPQVGPFIVEKLWRFLIDDNPDSETIATLSAEFVASDFALDRLIQQLLLQDAFWQASGSQIKSPMELVVGALQLFNLPMLSQRHVLWVSGNMGQDLFSPPHVKGWPGGNAWYSTANLAVRERAVKYFTRQAQKTVSIQQLLATHAVASLPEANHPDFLTAVLNDPAFQVV